MKFTILIVAMTMASSFSSPAQDLKKQLYDVMANNYPQDAPGAALLVIRNDSLIISKGFGITDFHSKNVITSNTNFRMASVSKQFTAFGILLLAHQKKIKLSDFVSKYLKDLPACCQSITIRDLLTHSSGIQDYESLIPASQARQVSDADVLDLVSKTDSIYFEPGSRFRYSNTGYCLLTQIIEKITGMPYPEYMRTQIFQPLGMRGSSLMQPGKSIADRAFGYHNKNGKWQYADQSITSATMGDGCVYTSLEDYSKWIRALWDEDLLVFNKENDPLLPHIAIANGLDYGYGWFTSKSRRGSHYDFHSGESTGFHNIVFQQPDKKLLIVIFSNSDDERISAAFEGVSRLLNIEWPLQMQDRSLFEYLHSIYE